MANGVTEQVAQRTADSAAAGSAFLAGASWLAEAEPYLTALAALVAVFAGAASAWYHIERARYLRRKSKDDNNA